MGKLSQSSRTYFYQHPLVMLHISVWSIYIIVDMFDHVKSGYFYFLPSIFCGLSAMFLTGLVAKLSSYFENKSIKIQAGIFVSSLLASAILWHKIFEILHRLDDTTIQQELEKLMDYSLGQWLQTGYMPLFLFLAWGGVYFAAKWYLISRRNEDFLNQALLESKHAQLQSLRYQLNPHFLFNVLNSIDVSLLNNDKKTAHNMLKYLSGFLRNSLQHGEQNKITLAEEISIIRDFVEIERLRFGDALSINIDIDEVCKHAMIPPMLLQPLVENAIKFAWSQTEKGIILIKVSKQVENLKIEVNNNKCTLGPAKEGTGIGLKNTQSRLQLLYGRDAYLKTIDSDDEFKIEVCVPYEVEI